LRLRLPSPFVSSFETDKKIHTQRHRQQLAQQAEEVGAWVGQLLRQAETLKEEKALAREQVGGWRHEQVTVELELTPHLD
jgi:hypothetical protein